jgi:VanZ family protein
VLIILSLVPGSDRPHTGYPGNSEHIAAYILAAAATKLAFPTIKSRYHILAFSFASAFFEISQIWIPGRSPGFDNWASSSFGALIGTGVVRLLLKAVRPSSTAAP